MLPLDRASKCSHRIIPLTTRMAPTVAGKLLHPLTQNSSSPAVYSMCLKWVSVISDICRCLFRKASEFGFLNIPYKNRNSSSWGVAPGFLTILIRNNIISWCFIECIIVWWKILRHFSGTDIIELLSRKGRWQKQVYKTCFEINIYKEHRIETQI